MRIRTQRVLCAAALALTCGCSTATPSSSVGRRDANTALVAVHEQQSQQAARIEELEARISLLEADARRTRSDDTSAARPGDTVRIGAETREQVSTRPAADSGNDRSNDVDVRETAAAGKRPRLRLYGRKEGEIQDNALPAVPVVEETLPIAPLPSQRGTRATTTVNTQAAPKSDSELVSYMAGLRFLRERRFDEALTAFGSFVDDHPSQHLVSNALYWRGEAHYAKREYAHARGEFEAVLSRFPQSEKAADSLLKLALCFRQLGSEDQARGAFRRLRTEYPKSQAATLAAREGAS